LLEALDAERGEILTFFCTSEEIACLKTLGGALAVPGKGEVERFEDLIAWQKARTLTDRDLSSDQPERL
jgi:hypothetical protein